MSFYPNSEMWVSIDAYLSILFRQKKESISDDQIGFLRSKRSNLLDFCLLLRLLRLQIDHWSDLQNDTYQTKPQYFYFNMQKTVSVYL